MRYIIEHLEPRIYSWCLIEYENISQIVGKENTIFTNIKTNKQKEKLLKLGKVYKESIRELALTTFKNKRLCLLDANAEETLAPKDAKNFDFLILGGILGDNPPRGRTMKELGKLKIPLRNLGKKQMATDTAVYVANKIIFGTPFENLKFIDQVEIRIREGESITIPFRYVVEQGKPLISPKLVEYLKKKRGF